MIAGFDLSPLLDQFAGPVGLKLSLALVHFLWQGVLVAACAAILMRVIGRRSPRRRYAIGVMCLIGMGIAPVVTFCLVTPPEPLAPFVEEIGSSEVLLAELEHLDALLTTTDLVLEPSSPLEEPRPVPLSWPERIRLWQPYALLVWLVGTGVFALRLGVGVRASCWLRLDRRRLPAEWLDAATKVGAQLGLKQPRIFVSDRIVEAVAVGLLKPMVLLPATWIGQVPLPVLEAVLAHELAHLRRHDLWVNLLQRVIEAVLFYHPAVWWLSRRVRIEREYCCDETAAVVVSGRATYARALEFVATARVSGLHPALFNTALAAGLGGDQMELLNRVRRVLDTDTRPPRGNWLSEGLLALAVPVALWAAIATVGPELAKAEDADEVEEVSDSLAEDGVEAPEYTADRQAGDGPYEVRELVEEMRVDGESVLIYEVEDGRRIASDAAGGTALDRDLREILQELRSEVKSLRKDVEALRSGSASDPAAAEDGVSSSPKPAAPATRYRIIMGEDDTARLRIDRLPDSSEPTGERQRSTEIEREYADAVAARDAALHKWREAVKSGDEKGEATARERYFRMRKHTERLLGAAVDGRSPTTVRPAAEPPFFDSDGDRRDPMPAEPIGKERPRFREVMEPRQTKDGRTIYTKRCVPVEPGADSESTEAATHPSAAESPALDSGHVLFNEYEPAWQNWKRWTTRVEELRRLRDTVGSNDETLAVEERTAQARLREAEQRLLQLHEQAERQGIALPNLPPPVSQAESAEAKTKKETRHLRVVPLELDGKKIQVIVEERREGDGPAKEIEVRVLKEAEGDGEVYSNPSGAKLPADPTKASAGDQEPIPYRVRVVTPEELQKFQRSREPLQRAGEFNLPRIQQLQRSLQQARQVLPADHPAVRHVEQQLEEAKTSKQPRSPRPEPPSAHAPAREDGAEIQKLREEVERLKRELEKAQSSFDDGAARISQFQIAGPKYMTSSIETDNKFVAAPFGVAVMNRGGVERFRLHFPDREFSVSAWLHAYPGTAETAQFLNDNKGIPIRITNEDLDQIAAGHGVTKVYYLPKPEFRDLASGELQTLVSTRLEPGVDPLIEADRRGATVAVLRLYKQPRLLGEILAVDRDKRLVQISLGTDGAVRRGQRFRISRDGKYLGLIEVTNIRQKTSIARIVEDQSDEEIRLGDTVAPGPSRTAHAEEDAKPERIQDGEPPKPQPADRERDLIDEEAIEAIEKRFRQGQENDSFPPYTEPPVPIERAR